jgi:hypothetical protein
MLNMSDNERFCSLMDKEKVQIRNHNNAFLVCLMNHILINENSNISCQNPRLRKPTSNFGIHFTAIQ